MSKLTVAVFSFLLSANLAVGALAQDGKDIKTPSGVDPFRLKLLKKAEKHKVYRNMVGIGDAKDEKVLFTRSKGDAVGTHQEMNARFESAVKNSERFDAFSNTSGGLRDQSDLVVIYLASHSMPKQEGISGFCYPSTYDTRFSEKASIIDFEEIQSLLMALPSRRVLWVADTCHSGGATLGLPVVEISSRGVRLGNPVSGLSTRAATTGTEEKDLAVLSSAREEQVALEDGENGLFTLMLADGFRRTKGEESICRVDKAHLEALLPERLRQIDPGYHRQPTFARSGKGDAIRF